MAMLSEADILRMIWEQEPFTEYDVQNHELNKHVGTLIRKELIVKLPSSTDTHIYALTGKGEKQIAVDEGW
jgi:DNA-binding MarR family transcriptional regulator